MIDAFGPPGVVVSERRVVVQWRGNIEPFFGHRSSVGTADLLELVRPELRAALQRSLHGAAHGGTATTTRGVRLGTASRGEVIDVEAIPLAIGAAGERYFLVLFLAHATASRPFPELSDEPRARERRALTPREREVLQLLAEGLSSKEIASRLAVSVATVHTHRRTIASKVGRRSIAELTKYAIGKGITSLDE